VEQVVDLAAIELRVRGQRDAMTERGVATSLTSSGSTKERAAMRATALAARMSAMGPREPAPMAMPGQPRVARTIRTA